MKLSPSTQRVLDAALYVAKKRGLRSLTRKAVADQAGLSVGTVSMAFVNMHGLETAVVKEAIRTEIWPIVREAIVLKHQAVRTMSKEDKLRALATLL